MLTRTALVRQLLDAADRPISVGDPLLSKLLETHPADVAFALEELDPEDSLRWFTKLDPEKAAEVLVEFEQDEQKDVVKHLPVNGLAEILDHLAPDDAADVYLRLPERLRNVILGDIGPELAEQIRILREYEEESAGGIMTPTFIAVPETETLAEAMERYKAVEDLETDQLYIVDGQGCLCGVLSIQELLHEENRDQPVSQLMNPKVYSVQEGADQEEVVKIATNYGLTTVPVIDSARKLVGIVTADDMDQVAEDEASEDIYRLAGSLTRHPTKEPVGRRILARIPMLMVTVVIGLVISELTRFLIKDESPEGQALRFLPIIIALAGNVAAVANAVVVRGLATGEIEHGRLKHPFTGEFMVGVGVGVLAAIFTWLGIWGLEGGGLSLPTAVSLSLFAGVLFSAVSGFATPVAFDKLGIDPALTGPFVISVNDLAGTAVYVAFCLLLLQV